MKKYLKHYNTAIAGVAVALVVLVFGWLTPVKEAKAIYCSNCGNEWTQLMNNFELVQSVNQQTVMVATQAKQYITELNQWQATLQNIANLPANVYSTIMGPYNTIQGANENFMSSIHNLRASTMSFESNFKNKMQAAGKQGISGAEYSKLEAQLARERGGEFKKQQDNDIKQMDELKARMQAVREASARIPGLQGNVEAMGLLNQQMNMVTTNLEEMRGIMLRDSAAKAADNATASDAKAVQAERDRQRRENARKAQEKNMNGSIPTLINPFGQ